MSTSGEAADQVVKMTLDGVEVAAKITGVGAKELAALLYAVLKDQKKTKGKTRLSSMLRSEKELKVFAVKDDELKRFCQEAKKYGVLYCVLKDRDATDGITDIMVKAEDASKINRIFERFELSVVDMGEIKNELKRAVEKGTDIPEPERIDSVERGDDVPNKEEGQSKNPTGARAAKSRQSEPTSETKNRNAESPSAESAKPSVKKELDSIRKEQKKSVANNKPSRKPKNRGR